MAEDLDWTTMDWGMFQSGHNIAETRVGSSRFFTSNNVTVVKQFLNFDFVAMEVKNLSLI